ncbi:MAG: response regulator transcription factor [Lachnospiraceae bacterium]|nr:response regulator transcription factor [Lachnospiraceae bacterium]
MSGEERNGKVARILLIEDEEKLAETLADYLQMSGYEVIYALSGYRGMELFYDRMHELDLILLDIMLPDISGSEILKEIRQRSKVPVIMVTARSSVQDQLQNFENGADDYITKPYVLSIVKVHIEAVLKRVGKLQKQIRAGGIVLEPEGRKAFCDGKRLFLTPREYEMLEYLICNRKRVQGRETILEALWGYHYVGDTRTVDTIIKQLRKKLGKYGGYIKSVYGVGYLFEDGADEG